MDFKTFFLRLPSAQRQAFAANVGATSTYLRQLCYGNNKRVSLGLADAIVAASGGEVDIRTMALSENAQRHLAARNGQPFSYVPMALRKNRLSALHRAELDAAIERILANPAPREERLNHMVNTHVGRLIETVKTVRAQREPQDATE